MHQSIDCYGPDPGSHHKTTVITRLLFWFGLLALVKVYLHQVFVKSEKISKEQFLFYRFTNLLSFSDFTEKFFVMKSLRWDVHCNTSSQRKHKPSVHCSISVSNIYMTIKAFSRNITSSTNLAYREKVNLQVPVMLPFEGLFSFLCKEKSTKCTYFASGRCFLLFRV